MVAQAVAVETDLVEDDVEANMAAEAVNKEYKVAKAEKVAVAQEK